MKFIHMNYQREEGQTRKGLIFRGYSDNNLKKKGNPAKPLTFFAFLVLVFSVQNPVKQNFLLLPACLYLRPGAEIQTASYPSTFLRQS